MSAEERIVEILQKEKMTVATAESCTGGLVAATLVDVAGVSEVFHQGYITYANEAKVSLIGVNRETLQQFGAVSPQTAWEMAAGAARVAGADCSLVTTGIAGPGGGTPEKPVGLVYIGCAVKGQVTVQKYQFQGNRTQVRTQAARAALELLLASLQAALEKKK